MVEENKEKVTPKNYSKAEAKPSAAKVEKASISWQRFICPNIHMDAWKFIGIAALIAVLLGIISAPLGLLGWAVTVFVFFFFRDPDRITPVDDSLVISPADGIVNLIEEVAPPAELDLGTEPVVRISIFLSLFNVHINRVPATGKITKLVYIPGKFFNASLEKASKHNERQIIAMKTKEGNKDLVFVQIAGLVARRILCSLNEGEEVKSGQKFGLIRFGSRMDIYLPKGVEALVSCGQEMVGGETILADLNVKTARKGEIR